MSSSQSALAIEPVFPSPLLASLQRRHSAWYFWTLAYAVLAGLCLVAGLFDERLFQGVSLWHKPFKFALSLAVYFVTLAWFANLMPQAYFDTTKGKWLTAIPIVCAFLEMAYIFIQAARGEASHFNYSSNFYSAMYSLMGVGAVLLVAMCLWMGITILRHRGSSNLWVLSVGIGLIGTFVLGGGFGGYLGSAGQHWVGGNATDAGGLPIVHWSRTGGDLRVAHFFGIHAMQIVPLLGAGLVWLQNKERVSASLARLILISASIAFAAFCTATFTQALRGAPFV